MSLAPFLLAVLTAGQTGLADRIWLEGETATRTTFAFRTSDGGHATSLSGGRWLSADLPAAQAAAQVPSDGIGAEYDFRAPAEGAYDVWVRVGYEAARSMFRWRLDGGDWSTVRPDAFTIDLMPLADGVPIGWRKLGTAHLRAGAHTFEVRIPPPLKTVGTRTESTRLVFGLDAVLFTRGLFVPNGPYRPDTPWKTPIDRLADKTVFEFPVAEVGPHQALTLVGAWQVARWDEEEIADRTRPIAELPSAEHLVWRGTRIPGDTAQERPDLAHAHRLLFRARVRVPPRLSGRTFLLKFPNNAIFSTVFVNGRRCGTSTTPFAPFECDATAAIRPGEVNEIIVGIKDAHYAVARSDDGRTCRQLFDMPTDHLLAPDGPARFADVPLLRASPRSGILETPTLLAVGSVVIADVFARPSVERKRLAVDVTVRNPAAAAVTAVVRVAARSLASDGTPFGGDPAKTLPPTTVTIPAGQSSTVSLGESWERPQLWWPDAPHRYVLETTVDVRGQPSDEVSTVFGFREWGWTDGAFTLNGVPWALRADLRHAGRQPGRYAEEAVRDWRRVGQTFVTFAGERPWTEYSQAETLDFFDRLGMPVRRAGALDLSAGYALGPSQNPAFGAAWRAQLAAWVTAERNHPSVFAWSIGTGTADGRPEWLERELMAAVTMITALDPTRPVVIDRGVQRQPPTASDRIPTVRNIALPSALGVAVTAGSAAAQPLRGVDRQRMEACRWASVAGVQFQGVVDESATWQPVAVLCREADADLPAGETVSRTLKVFNDTRQASPITVHWLLQTRGTKVRQVRGKKVLTVPPGRSEVFVAELTVPDAATDADFVLSCVRDGQTVFLDVRRCKIVAK